MRRLVYFLPALLPAAFTLLLVVVWLRGNLYSYLPTTEGLYYDGVYHTRQIFTFRWVGMNGGYFTRNEQPAAAPYSPFYTQGPAYPLVYGTLSKLVNPIFPQTIVIFHLIGVTLGGILFLHLAHLRGSSLLWFVAYIVTCWSALFYLPSAMQEGMHITLAFVLAGLAIPIIRDGANAPLNVKIVFGILVGAAALTRPSWAFLLLPYALLIQPSRSWHRLALAIAISGAAIISLTVLYFYHAAPSPLDHLPTTLGLEAVVPFLQAHLEMALDNINTLLTGDALTLMIRWQTVLMVSVGVWVLLREGQIMRRLRGVVRQPVPADWLSVQEALFHTLHLGLILVGVMMVTVFGVSQHDFRLLAPHRFMTVLLLIAFQRWKLVIAVIAFNILVLPAFLDSYYKAWHIQFLLDRPQVRAFVDEVRQVFPHDPDAPSRWCNTLLMPLGPNTSFPPEILAFPPGIGVSFYHNANEVARPVQSHYLLLNENHIDDFPELDLTPLKDTRIGTFYRNEDVLC